MDNISEPPFSLAPDTVDAEGGPRPARAERAADMLRSVSSLGTGGRVSDAEEVDMYGVLIVVCSGSN